MENLEKLENFASELPSTTGLPLATPVDTAGNTCDECAKALTYNVSKKENRLYLRIATETSPEDVMTVLGPKLIALLREGNYGRITSFELNEW